jgi:hypothetical protein
MGKGRKSEYIKFKYDKSKHCQCGTGKEGPEINRNESTGAELENQRVLKDLWTAKPFSESYNLAPPPPPSPASKLDRRHAGRLRKRDNLLTGKG